MTCMLRMGPGLQGAQDVIARSPQLGASNSPTYHSTSHFMFGQQYGQSGTHIVWTRETPMLVLAIDVSIGAERFL